MLLAFQRKVPPDRYQEIKYSHWLGQRSVWIKTYLRSQLEKAPVQNTTLKDLYHLFIFQCVHSISSYVFSFICLSPWSLCCMLKRQQLNTRSLHPGVLLDPQWIQLISYTILLCILLEIWTGGAVGTQEHLVLAYESFADT